MDSHAQSYVASEGASASNFSLTSSDSSLVSQAQPARSSYAVAQEIRKLVAPALIVGVNVRATDVECEDAYMFSGSFSDMSYPKVAELLAEYRVARKLPAVRWITYDHASFPLHKELKAIDRPYQEPEDRRRIVLASVVSSPRTIEKILEASRRDGKLPYAIVSLATRMVRRSKIPSTAKDAGVQFHSIASLDDLAALASRSGLREKLLAENATSGAHFRNFSSSSDRLYSGE